MPLADLRSGMDSASAARMIVATYGGPRKAIDCVAGRVGATLAETLAPGGRLLIRRAVRTPAERPVGVRDAGLRTEHALPRYSSRRLVLVPLAPDHTSGRIHHRCLDGAGAVASPHAGPRALALARAQPSEPTSHTSGCEPDQAPSTAGHAAKLEERDDTTFRSSPSGSNAK